MLIKISGSSRFGRGGSWYNYADLCEVTSRNNRDPYDRDDNIGFRVLRRCVYVNKNKRLLPSDSWR